ncbi:ABC transporter substrate-binding protein [Luteococcus sp. OSA5]|uniref:ABC transporter substrate-binding protein n=1 Tax=Luteococcus sp. OSA5 TaxID=3401630 RepID=UPI003B42DB8C
MHQTRRGLVTLALGALLSLTACSVTAPPSPGTSQVDPSQSGAETGQASLTLADSYELGAFNPVSGHGELGVSPLYDGLLRLSPTREDQLPGFAPALATELPTHNAELTRWSVPLRSGVKFHDGSTFDAADVTATYQAVLDPRSGSEIASAFEMIQRVEAVETSGQQRVVFHLKYPYADFPARLLLAIAPSEKLTGGLASQSSLNREPVGTGPYRLESLTADRAVLVADPGHWRGAPQVKRLTTVLLPDDNARALRVRNGEFDGTVIPPTLAASFATSPGQQVVTAQSADWRGVSLPANSVFGRDPRVRRALNLAVDRQAMLTTVLAGHGRLAHTPMSPVHGQAHAADATFPHDRDAARALLAEAGWRPGKDGVLTKDGHRASFPLAYTPDDTVRRDLATAFAADMKKIGVEVRLEALGWDRIEPRIGELGILLGGGDKPYSVDTQVYAALHSPRDGTSIYDNPGRVANKAIDRALDQARRTSDPKSRNALYRNVQHEYLKDPAYVMLVFVDHTYVTRDAGWKRGPLTVEPHAHGVGWGPWWNVASWTR